MNESTASPAHVAICLVLLGSCCLQCLSFQNTEQRYARQLQQRAAPAENRLDNIDNASLSSPEGRSGLPEQTVGAAASESPYGASAEPSGISLNTRVKATPQTVLGVQGLLGQQAFSVYTTAVSGVRGAENQLTSSESAWKDSGSRKSLLVARVTSPNPNVKDQVLSSSASSSVNDMIEGASEGTSHDSAGNLGVDIFAPSILEESVSVGHAGVPLLTTEDSLFWSPTDQSPSLLPSARQSVDTERVSNGDGPSLPTDATAKPSLVSTEAFFSQPEDTSDSWGRSQVMPGGAADARATALPGDDWDDTKPGASSQARGTTAKAVDLSQMAGKSYPGEGREEDDDEVKRVLPPRLSAATLEKSQTIQTGSVLEPVRWGESTTLLAGQNTVPATDLSPKGQIPPVGAIENSERVAKTHEAATTIDTTKSDVFQTLRNTLRGVTQEAAEGIHETDAVLSTTTPGDFPNQEATGEGRLATHILRSSAVPERPENSASPVSPLGTDLSVIPTPEAEGPTAVLKKKDDAPVDDVPATPAGLLAGEIPGATVAASALPSASASARRTTNPTAHHVTTAVAYGLEGLESEEEEEEEEDEEEEEEPDEEEEEEDDEDEKDANSMDESLDGDAGQTSFTLPGETSQDPLESLEDPVGVLSGVSYQVPGDIEWERQNQGLVRNWMRKLKDKAGYMSGMLVPVGVGIAGALMILVTLYSVKIMNRQRRNSFKRHKQKQREFNSMQDRVMLLADSSEDEF